MITLDNQYGTLLEAITDLKKKGYTDELTITQNGLFNQAGPLDPAHFKIDSFHRFEGESDPADMSILYAISSEHFNAKGLLVGDYGGMVRDYIHKMVGGLDAQTARGKVQPVRAATAGKNVKR